MHKKVIQLFHVGEIANRFPKGGINQNVHLDTKVKMSEAISLPLNTVQLPPHGKVRAYLCDV